MQADEGLEHQSICVRRDRPLIVDVAGDEYRIHGGFGRNANQLIEGRGKLIDP
jgi:hypothetical protein